MVSGSYGPQTCVSLRPKDDFFVFRSSSKVSFCGVGFFVNWLRDGEGKGWSSGSKATKLGRINPPSWHDVVYKVSKVSKDSLFFVFFQSHKSRHSICARWQIGIRSCKRKCLPQELAGVLRRLLGTDRRVLSGKRKGGGGYFTAFSIITHFPIFQLDEHFWIYFSTQFPEAWFLLLLIELQFLICAVLERQWLCWVFISKSNTIIIYANGIFFKTSLFLVTQGFCLGEGSFPPFRRFFN